MANPATTFRGFYAQAPDPYPDPNAFYAPFRADPLIQPGTIFNTIESHTYPLMLLMNSTEHRPIVAVAPFSPQVLPGTDKYVFAGDISDAGALPAMVTIMNARFHLTDNVDVWQLQIWTVLGRFYQLERSCYQSQVLSRIQNKGGHAW